MLSHSEDGPPGLLADWLAERAIPFEVRNVAREPMPALAGRPFVAALGSEESATDRGLPWVAAEIELLRDAVARSVPVLGLCFGGQALSIALGGRVARARRPQVGWFEIVPATGAAVPRGPWLHWHYEQFETPPGARALAASAVGPSAFALGRHLGLQFHPEVTPAIVAGWSRAQDELAALGLAADALVAESRRQLPRARADAWRLFDAWWARRDA